MIFYEKLIKYGERRHRIMGTPDTWQIEELIKYGERRHRIMGAPDTWQIKISTQGNFTIAQVCKLMLPNVKDVSVGVTKCSPLDEFDPDIGRKIALWRALDAYFGHDFGPGKED